MSKSNHGGYRDGAGRKINSGKYKEETVQIRIPVSLIPKVRAMLDKLEKKVNK